MLRSSRRLALAVATTVAALMLSTTADAQALVLGSDTGALRPGRVLETGETVAVQKGASVRVMLPSGATRVLKGPQDVKISELTQGTPADTDLWNTVTAYVTTAPPDDEPFTRGLAPASTPPDRFPFSWHDIPTNTTGDICVEKGARLSLVRPPSKADATVTVIDMQGGGLRGEAHFGKGEERAPWPETIPLKVGSYALSEPGQPPRQFRLRLITPIPGADDAIRVLHGQRCAMQRDALIDALRDPAFDPASAR